MMKASECVKELQQLTLKHGDLNISVINLDRDTEFASEIDVFKTDGEDTFCIS